MALKDDVAKIVGEENVTDLKKSGSNTHATTVSSAGVLTPWHTQRILRSKRHTEVLQHQEHPVVPVSSRQHFHGCTIRNRAVSFWT